MQLSPSTDTVTAQHPTGLLEAHHQGTKIKTVLFNPGTRPH